MTTSRISVNTSTKGLMPAGFGLLQTDIPQAAEAENVQYFLDVVVDTIKHNRELMQENKELKITLGKEKRKVEFLRQELKKARKGAAPIPIDNLIREFTSSGKGKAIWQKVNQERKAELAHQVKEGKMNKIRFFRIVKEMDQKELAKLMKTKQSNIARLEQIGYQPRIGTLKRLAKVFNIDVKELV